MDASTHRVPPKVAALAERQQLGPLVASHKGDNPLVECATGLVIAAVLFGAAAGITWVISLVEFLQVKALALLVLLLAIGGLAAAGYAFFKLFGAYVVVHHFEHGLVWTRNRSIEAAAWSWIDEMYVNRKDAKATGAGLVTLDGRSLDVTGAEKADYTAFVDGLEAAVTARRRPVLAARRVVSRGPAGIGLSDRALAVMAVIGGGALVAAIAVPLSRTGLPGPLAAVIGFLIIGIAIGLIGTRADSRVTVIGGIFASIGGLVLMIAVARLLPQLNAYLVATVVLAAEMGILAAVLNTYRGLPALPPTRARKRLAARQGWEFLPSLTVQVPGPQTAAKLIGVQEGARSVDLYDVVRGTVNGVPVLAGDRHRRKPRRSDPVQTVWIVPLPAPVPFLTNEAFSNETPVEQTFAQLFTNDPARPAHLNLPAPWWMEGQYLICEAPGDPDTILARANALTRAATAMPWDAIRTGAPGTHPS